MGKSNLAAAYLLDRPWIAIFFLLLMINTANAQFAWVLWEMEEVQDFKDGNLSKNSQWKVLEAAPKYKQCMEAQRATFEK